MCVQEAEEPRVLLLLLSAAAAADVRTLRQGEMYAEIRRLRGAPPRRLHHRPRYGGKDHSITVSVLGRKAIAATQRI